MKNTALVLHHDFLNMFYLHSYEEIGELVMAAFRYDISGKGTEFEDRAMTASFMRITDFIDKNKEKYEKTCQRRAAAAERRRIKMAVEPDED